MKYLAILLFFVFSCKGAVDSSQKNSILKILSENQKIHEQLIAKSDSTLDTKALFNSIKEAELICEKNKDLKVELEKLELTLSNINTSDQEAFFKSMSSFSEKLTDILKANKIGTDYHKFYCPMVEKYWIAKGEGIQNPYAPEMRDCGELVK
jgi:hypothetical protein